MIPFFGESSKIALMSANMKDWEQLGVKLNRGPLAAGLIHVHRNICSLYTTDCMYILESRL